MQKEYPITADGKTVGTAYISPQGLYYEVRCICKMQRSVLHIEADCGNRMENIGICVPMDGKMVISTRIPQKKLNGCIGFTVRTQTREIWIPLNSGAPIPHLHRITEARFAVRAGIPGLLIQVTAEVHPSQKSENKG